MTGDCGQDVVLEARSIMKHLSLRVGQQQIVEIANALICRARVILIDQPTSALSDQGIEVFVRLIDDWQRQDLTMVVVSSELPELLGIAGPIELSG